MTGEDTPEWVDGLYSELDELAEECITEEDANPLEVAQVVHDYAEQFKLQIMVEQRKVSKEQYDEQIQKTKERKTER